MCSMFYVQFWICKQEENIIFHSSMLKVSSSVSTYIKILSCIMQQKFYPEVPLLSPVSCNRLVCYAIVCIFCTFYIHYCSLGAAKTLCIQRKSRCYYFYLISLSRTIIGKFKDADSGSVPRDFLPIRIQIILPDSPDF